MEDELNAILIEMIVAVEGELRSRRQQEEARCLSHEYERRLWQQEQERRQEEKKVQELNQSVQNWDQANRIRVFVAQVREVRGRDGRIDEGTELGAWIAWALKQADMIDPLAPRSNQQFEVLAASDGSKPVLWGESKVLAETRHES